MLEKKTYFFIDDVIWVFRDITRQKPVSLFDNSFMKMLKNGHEKYGIKTQLNIFYRTDYFYGDDEFTLSEMTDSYKAEWEAASDWLKLGFHAKQEFPDYPHINADYDDVKNCFDKIYSEVRRFAGDKSFARAVIPHWLPVSKDGCKALFDSGIKIMSVTTGDVKDYDGNPDTLPYGHAQRFLNNRKPETRLFTREEYDDAILSSICGYNHLTKEEVAPIQANLKLKKDNNGFIFKDLGNGPCLNLTPLEETEERFKKHLGNEYIGYLTHEQYFYPEYFGYQSDYEDKFYLAGKILSKNGYEYIFAEDLV